ncbi:MAG: hypothetical protein IAF08_15660 [Rhizobacter sp.]|nr:hypothetical protein [Chlorobiales bacterium]
MSSSTPSGEITERWDAFLAKIKERFEQTMSEAEAGCAALLDDAELDPMPMSNAWNAIRLQMLSLQRKIGDTWSEKIQEQLYDPNGDAKFEGAKVDREYAKGFALEQRIADELQATEVRIFGSAARKIYEVAKTKLEGHFACKQCGTPLQIPKGIFRSIYVVCASCAMTNTFEPGTFARSAEYFCAHYLANETAWPELKAMSAAEFRVNRAIDGDSDSAGEPRTLAMLKMWEAATKKYWEVYLKARIEIIPEYAADYDKDFNGKMQGFYNDVARYDEWKSPTNTSVNT